MDREVGQICRLEDKARHRNEQSKDNAVSHRTLVLTVESAHRYAVQHVVVKLFPRVRDNFRWQHNDRTMEPMALGVIDASVLAGLLVAPAIIGSVSAFRQPSQSVRDFLVGSRALRVLPTALSLIASNMSGVTVLGYPAEIYSHGAQFAFIALGAVVATFAVILWYLPIFFKLQVTSSYEYLEKRFDFRVRRITSVLFVVRSVLYLPVVLYVPAVTLNQATGISVGFAVPVLALLATCYTTAGGLRVVALTGSLQVAIMFISIVTLITIGLSKVGGTEVVWQRLQDGGRLNLDLSLNPFKRATLWATVFGGAFFWLQMLGVQPNSVQRYVAVPTMSAARKSAVIQCVGLVLNTLLCTFLGALIFAFYHACDPVASKVVSRADQIVPHFVLDVSRNIPGLAGFFMAGICSAALGNLSAGLHTLATTIHRDFIRQRTRSYQKDRVIVRLLVIVGAAWTVAGSFLIGHLGGVVQAAMSLGGISSGTLLGVFTLGMFFRRANAKGALIGAAVSLTVMAVIGGGAQIATLSGSHRVFSLPTRTDGCDTINNTDGVSTSPSLLWPTVPSILLTTPSASHSSFDASEPFRLSYLWYVATGCVIVLVVGSIVSLVNHEESSKGTVDRVLLASCVRGCEEDADQEMEELGVKSLERNVAKEATIPLR